MSFQDLYILITIGGIFIVLGIFGLLWGSREEGIWYGVVSSRIDVREFLDHSPGRPEPNALRSGGKICIAVGVVILLVCGGFYLWGMAPVP